ncbi:polymorphic toxin type 8 domain-containing protein, partial [Virgibacillus dokdonensis]
GGVIKFANKGKHTAKKVNSSGRAGKQRRLKEIADDNKVSSALRGEIRRDINEIKLGKRKNIRVPQGYHLAHRRGYEARKGYGYKYSVIYRQ